LLGHTENRSDRTDDELELGWKPTSWRLHSGVRRNTPRPRMVVRERVRSRQRS
jgi:hypothetical protein